MYFKVNYANDRTWPVLCLWPLKIMNFSFRAAPSSCPLQTSCPKNLRVARVSRTSGLRTYPFVNLSMLQLNKSCTYCRYVTLLVTECYTSRSFGILQLRIRIDSSITDTPVKSIHDHRKIKYKKYPWNIKKTPCFWLVFFSVCIANRPKPAQISICVP